jgi:hypothetical protein
MPQVVQWPCWPNAFYSDEPRSTLRGTHAARVAHDTVLSQRSKKNGAQFLLTVPITIKTRCDAGL